MLDEEMLKHLPAEAAHILRFAQTHKLLKEKKAGSEKPAEKTRVATSS